MPPPPNLSNNTSRVIPTSEVNTETSEGMNRQSVLKELGKQKMKLSIAQDREKSVSNKVKSPVKRKSKCTYRSSRENDKKRKKEMRDNLEDDAKEKLKNDAKSKFFHDKLQFLGKMCA